MTKLEEAWEAARKAYDVAGVELEAACDAAREAGEADDAYWEAYLAAEEAAREAYIAAYEAARKAKILAREAAANKAAIKAREARLRANRKGESK